MRESRIGSTAMPLPRVRFTVRRMMVAVGAVAILLSLGMLWERSRHFDKIARIFASKESYAVQINRGHFGTWPRDREFWLGYKDGVYSYRPENVAYYSHMRSKYERLAKSPWLSVPPDPPEPE